MLLNLLAKIMTSALAKPPTTTAPTWASIAGSQPTAAGPACPPTTPRPTPALMDANQQACLYQQLSCAAQTVLIDVNPDNALALLDRSPTSNNTLYKFLNQELADLTKKLVANSYLTNEGDSMPEEDTVAQGLPANSSQADLYGIQLQPTAGPHHQGTLSYIVHTVAGSWKDHCSTDSAPAPS
ncbi:hypothetical protein DXG03_007497 [Asterophora parasitica]|uniref:Uncharacterized protein n=1 Tax=Asterophora parasitica TaxID=117018 RepID=A0A9P7K6Y5_9AGAR|nr:hypothetical protein DXG03_007497 [Asterophora parasitica]